MQFAILHYFKSGFPKGLHCCVDSGEGMIEERVCDIAVYAVKVLSGAQNGFYCVHSLLINM
jgi:hypothetical protein